MGRCLACRMPLATRAAPPLSFVLAGVLPQSGPATTPNCKPQTRDNILEAVKAMPNSQFNRQYWCEFAAHVRVISQSHITVSRLLLAQILNHSPRNFSELANLYVHYSKSTLMRRTKTKKKSSMQGTRAAFTDY